LQAEQLKQFVNARLDVGPLPFLDLEAKGDVLEYIHVFEQRVILKDKADVALLDGELVDALAANEDVSLGRHFQAGNHAEHGRFAAAAGTKQRQQLAVIDGIADVVHGNHVAESLADVFQ